MTRVFVNKQLPSYNGMPLERGQVFALQHQLNDRKLLGLDYVIEVTDDMDTVTCTPCGTEFIDESTRNAHARAAAMDGRHASVDLEVGPLRGRPRTFGPINPDSDRDLPLEPEGAPPPLPPELTGVAPEKGSRIEQTGKGPRETFRLG